MTIERVIPAGEFKARSLALLDEVNETGEELVVTKRGRPVARVVPMSEVPDMLGSVLWEGDLTAPIEVEWKATRWSSSIHMRGSGGSQ